MSNRIQAQSIAALGGIAHGFFSRQGGRSEGCYASLNVGRGSDDLPWNVEWNRKAVTRELGARMLATPYQVHGSDALVIDASFDVSAPPKADALVTRARGLAVGTVTADCAPILLADAHVGVVAAAHAGWRGAAAGIVEATISAMEGLGARRTRICAAIGPTIAQPSYEIDKTVRNAFVDVDRQLEAFFAAGERPGHFQFDLEGAVAWLLSTSGVGSVEPMGLDTYRDDRRFFSYRRATHRGESDYGRQISAILRL